MAAGPRRPGSSIGVVYDTFLDQLSLIDAGLPAAAIDAFQQASGLARDEVNTLAGIRGDARDRQRLSAGQSERLLRLSRVFELAVDLYQGDRDGAIEWLQLSIPSLGDRRPLDLARSEPGAREVEDLIGRIQHGIVS